MGINSGNRKSVLEYRDRILREGILDAAQQQAAELAAQTLHGVPDASEPLWSANPLKTVL